MPDAKNYLPPFNTNPVVAGGIITLTLGTGAAPALCFGSGAPTLTAPKGSFYLNTTGSSTSTRAYINTDGGTTWTAVTTAG